MTNAGVFHRRWNIRIIYIDLPTIFMINNLYRFVTQKLQAQCTTFIAQNVALVKLFQRGMWNMPANEFLQFIRFVIQYFALNNIINNS